MKTKALIKLKNISKKYGNQTVVKSLDLEIMEGEFLTLLGPSGCGKTTILRMIAGFELQETGTIILDGKNLENITPNKREVNTVFQSYALFPHLNVRDNIGFGLKMQGMAKEDIKERVDNVLDLTNLDILANRKPDKLSGGQQQRVAIARGIVNEPKVLLLDEPLGALDLKLRKQMQLELKKQQRKLGITYVYVTHDQEEALTMSDRIVVMRNGEIEQIGTPWEVYYKPKTKFVAEFLGESNLFEMKNGTEIHVIRPEHIQVFNDKPEGFSFVGIVEKKIFLGQAFRVVIKLEDGRSVYALKDRFDIKEGSLVYISWILENAAIIS